MLAHILYEKIGNPQTARDDLQRSLPDLFGSRARGTLNDLVMQPAADFYPNHELGTLPTALSYFVQPNGGPFDELSIQLANYYQSARWTASIGAHVAPAVHQPDYDNWGFNMTWHGRNSSNTSGLLSVSWTPCTTSMIIDFGNGKVRFNGYYGDPPFTTPIAELANAQGKIKQVQSRHRVEMAGIELTGDLFGINFIERRSQEPLFDIVVPARITIDPERLKQHIKNPDYKS